MVIWFKLDNKPHKPGIDKKKTIFSAGWVFISKSLYCFLKTSTHHESCLSQLSLVRACSDANHTKGIERREQKKSRVVILHVDIPGVDEIAGASKPQLVYFVTCNVKPTKLTNMGRPRILEQMLFTVSWNCCSLQD